MSAPQNIPTKSGNSISNLSNSFNKSVGLSASPNSAGTSPIQYGFNTGRRLTNSFGAPLELKHLKPFNTGDIKILLLENVNITARDILNDRGYQVEFFESSLSEDVLIEKIKDVHAIGIRSKTKLTEKVLSHANNLITIGCFCIGTNQVDLEYAASRGIAVFNSPFSNSRSVAELVIGYIISLARQFTERSAELHHNEWNKVSKKCWEIRGKTLGIIGYGHIGSQLSVLAEAMGMNVLYYDVLPIMAMGTAVQVDSLHALLSNSDFVTLHVPQLPETHNMISAPQFAAMKQGSYLINASRGSVIDIPELVKARASGKLAGAAIDVFPNEPAKNGLFFTNELNSWTSELLSLKNIILTPHIGGSTEEAQSAIGIEVGTALSRYLSEGSSIGAVNFPEVNLKPLAADDTHVRVLYIHQNVPGVLKTVNEIFATHNIEKQYSESRGKIAYMMADIADVTKDDIKTLYDDLYRTPFRILLRLLY